MNKTEKIQFSEDNQTVLNENPSITEQYSKEKIGFTQTISNKFRTLDIRTPKLQNTNSLNKIRRVSSSKGIKVMSSRPSSTQKQPQHFSPTADEKLKSYYHNFKHPQPELIQRMREELQQIRRKYEQKMNQQLNYQYNHLTAELDHLKDLLRLNETKLSNKELELYELGQSYEKLKRRVQPKQEKIFKQIDELKSYYEKCYDYTLWRVNDIESKVHALSEYINQEVMQQFRERTAFKKEEIQDLIKSIVIGCGSKTTFLKFQVQEQIEHLNKRLRKQQNQVHDLDFLIGGIKEIQINHEGIYHQLSLFKQHIQECKKIQHHFTNLDDHLVYFEQKFQEILNTINGTSVEVQMIKVMYQEKFQQEEQKSQQTIFELSALVDKLQKKIDQQKQLSTEKMRLYEDQQRQRKMIEELQAKVKNLEEKKNEQTQEISNLNLKINYYQHKCEKASERDFNIQSKFAQTFSDQIVREKTRRFEEQKKQYCIEINLLKEKLERLDHQNYLLGQKITEIDNTKYKNIKLQAQHQYAYEQMKKSVQIYQEKTQILLSENSQLRNENSILNEELQQKIQILQNLTEEMESTVRNLSKMSQIKSENELLKDEVKCLENDLHQYASTFENQSITFRNAIEKLQTQKQQQKKEINSLSQENSLLKMDTTISQQVSVIQSSIKSSKIKRAISSQENLITPKKLIAKSLSYEVSQQKLTLLKKTIKALKLTVPLVCEVDETGYLKLQQTSMYLMDSDDNLFQLSDKEMQSAIDDGLILI